MTKAITGSFALGAIATVRPVARRIAREMREHCEQMATQCKQTAARVGGRGAEVGET